MVLVPTANPPGPRILSNYLIFIGILSLGLIKVHGIPPIKELHFIDGSNCNALIKLPKSMISPIGLRFIHSGETEADPQVSLQSVGGPSGPMGRPIAAETAPTSCSCRVLLIRGGILL